MDSIHNLHKGVEIFNFMPPETAVAAGAATGKLTATIAAAGKAAATTVYVAGKALFTTKQAFEIFSTALSTAQYMMPAASLGYATYTIVQNERSQNEEAKQKYWFTVALDFVVNNKTALAITGLTPFVFLVGFTGMSVTIAAYVSIGLSLQATMLLCKACNIALPYYEAGKEFLQKIWEYFHKSPGEIASETLNAGVELVTSAASATGEAAKQVVKLAEENPDVTMTVIGGSAAAVVLTKTGQKAMKNSADAISSRLLPQSPSNMVKAKTVAGPSSAPRRTPGMKNQTKVMPMTPSNTAAKAVTDKATEVLGNAGANVAEKATTEVLVNAGTQAIVEHTDAQAITAHVFGSVDEGAKIQANAIQTAQNVFGTIGEVARLKEAKHVRNDIQSVFNAGSAAALAEEAPQKTMIDSAMSGASYLMKQAVNANKAAGRTILQWGPAAGLLAAGYAAYELFTAEYADQENDDSLSLEPVPYDVDNPDVEMDIDDYDHSGLFDY